MCVCLGLSNGHRRKYSVCRPFLVTVYSTYLCTKICVMFERVNTMVVCWVSDLIFGLNFHTNSEVERYPSSNSSQNRGLLPYKRLLMKSTPIPSTTFSSLVRGSIVTVVGVFCYRTPQGVVPRLDHDFGRVRGIDPIRSGTVCPDTPLKTYRHPTPDVTRRLQDNMCTFTNNPNRTGTIKLHITHTVLPPTSIVKTSVKRSSSFVYVQTICLNTHSGPLRIQTTLVMNPEDSTEAAPSPHIKETLFFPFGLEPDEQLHQQRRKTSILF